MANPAKSAQQLSWDRVNEVIKYLVEKEGVNSDRFIFRYGQAGGDENTIDIKGWYRRRRTEYGSCSASEPSQGANCPKT